MAAGYIINGETLVKVKFGPHITPSGLQTLGVAEGPIVISPRFRHHDHATDKTGGELPADVMWLLGDVRIRMPLIYFDKDILDNCIKEARAGTTITTEVSAGTMLGRGKALGADGNHFVSLNLVNGDATNGRPWRFRASYLAEQPLEWPAGTKRSVVIATFRAISYFPLAEGTEGGETTPNPLWDHTLDS